MSNRVVCRILVALIVVAYFCTITGYNWCDPNWKPPTTLLTKQRKEVDDSSQYKDESCFFTVRDATIYAFSSSDNKSKLTFNKVNALTTCKDYNASLPSIHSDEQMKFLRNFAKSNLVPLGLERVASFDGTGYDYEWLDGSPFSYSPVVWNKSPSATWSFTAIARGQDIWEDFDTENMTLSPTMKRQLVCEIKLKIHSSLITIGETTSTADKSDDTSSQKANGELPDWAVAVSALAVTLLLVILIVLIFCAMQRNATLNDLRRQLEKLKKKRRQRRHRTKSDSESSESEKKSVKRKKRRKPKVAKKPAKKIIIPVKSIGLSPPPYISPQFSPSPPPPPPTESIKPLAYRKLPSDRTLPPSQAVMRTPSMPAALKEISPKNVTSSKPPPTISMSQIQASKIGRKAPFGNEAMTVGPLAISKLVFK